MSEYRSYSYNYTACVDAEAIRRRAAEARRDSTIKPLIDAVGQACSLFLATVKEMESQGRTRLEAAQGSLFQFPELRLATLEAARQMPGGGGQIESLLAGAGSSANLLKATANDLAESHRMELLLGDALSAGRERLYLRALLEGAVRGTLVEMGYETPPPRRSNLAGDRIVRAVKPRENKTAWVRLHPSCQLEIDLAGFHGGECTVEHQAFFEGLKRRGIKLVERGGAIHLDPHGGALAREIESLYGEESGCMHSQIPFISQGRK